MIPREGVEISVTMKDASFLNRVIPREGVEILVWYLGKSDIRISDPERGS